MGRQGDLSVMFFLESRFSVCFVFSRAVLVRCIYIIAAFCLADTQEEEGAG